MPGLPGFSAIGDGLPGYDAVDHIVLLGGGLAEVDAGGLDAFVSHQVGQEGEIILFAQKGFCVHVTEGVRVDDLGIQAVAFAVLFQLPVNAAGADAVSIPVEEQIAGFAVIFTEPAQCFLHQLGGNVEAADFAPFGVDVHVAAGDVLDFDLNQLADTGAGGSQIADDKVPLHVLLGTELIFQKHVVLQADDVIDVGFAGDEDGLQAQFRLAEEGEVFIQALDAEVDGFRRKIRNQVLPVCQQIVFRQACVAAVESFDGFFVRDHRVL